MLCPLHRKCWWNNDTKCLYFPFCLDQAPLTWLESLEKYSIDKLDQLKEQFTRNFAGAIGRSGTRMDLAMVKQEQGETLRKYMRRFFDKRATVVDVTDKEVIDLFQDGLYHRRTFEDFGRRRPSSITKLKDMITTQVLIKRKSDNIVVAIQRPVKDNSKKTSGGFKDLLKEKCPWHLRATILPNSATNSGEHSRTLQTHGLLTTRTARKKPTKATTTSKNPTRR
jgi:hypothetical protein